MERHLCGERNASESVYGSLITEFDPFAIQAFYDNEFHEINAAETIEIINPATEGIEGKLAICGEATVENVVERANAAQTEWATRSETEHGALLHAVADAISQRPLRKASTSPSSTTRSLARRTTRLTSTFDAPSSEYSKGRQTTYRRTGRRATAPLSATAATRQCSTAEAPAKTGGKSSRRLGPH